MKKYTRYDVPAEAFITAWQSSNDVEEVVAKLGLPKTVAYKRACAYRKMGIRLKRMRFGTEKLDIEKLSKLADDLAAKNETNTKPESDSADEGDALSPF